MQLLKRILITIVVLVIVSIVLLAGIVWAEASFGQSAQDFSNVSFTAADGTTLVGYLQAPNGTGPFPTVIMVHEWWGLSASIVEKANQMAAQGYVVFAPDTYRGQATRLIPRALWLRLNTPEDRVLADLQAAYEYLLTQPQVDRQRLAILGFCYGGGMALRYGTLNPDLAATIIFYGDPITNPANLGAIAQTRGPVLGIFAAQDQQIPVAEVEAFKNALAQAGVRHQVTIYPGVGHAFVQPDTMAQPGAAQDAWRETLAFLDANVKNKR
jgi:carboxymethylenebutenolidase